MAAAQPRPSLPPDGIDFVNEDDAGSMAFCLVEEVAHSGGADADKHLDKFTAADGKEWHAGLPGDCPGQQGLTSAGRAYQQHTSRDTCPQSLEFFTSFKKFDYLIQLLLGFIDTGYVSK